MGSMVRKGTDSSSNYLPLAGKYETIVSNRRANAAIPISAPEKLPNQQAIGRREATSIRRLLEQHECDSQRSQREANAQARDDEILSQLR